jgi:DNA polymerase-3 subunit alpha
MPRFYTKPCGCEFEISESHLISRGKELDWYLKNDLVPPIKLDIQNINMDCPEVWKMLGKGLVKGVFQLEGATGKRWTKEMKPTSIDHLCALGALLRPGCTKSIDKKTGCSLTELFCLRKNGLKEVEYLHPCLENVLKSTYGILTYQEQAMQIAQIVAGFNLQDADVLRKAIGKKLADEMAKVEKMFVEGARKVNILSEEQINEVFGWIKESQRYSFNKSHSMSYAVNGYWSAYCKCHFPIYFFTSWLRQARDKQDPLEEIRELINEAKLMDIKILTPDLKAMKKHFYTDGKTIRFGIADVKGIGEVQVDKLRKVVSEAEMVYGKKLADLNWYEFLVLVSPRITSTVIERLIEVGGMKYMDK